MLTKRKEHGIAQHNINITFCSNIWVPNSGNKVSIGLEFGPYRHYMCFFEQNL